MAELFMSARSSGTRKYTIIERFYYTLHHRYKEWHHPKLFKIEWTHRDYNCWQFKQPLFEIIHISSLPPYKTEQEPIFSRPWPPILGDTCLPITKKVSHPFLGEIQLNKTDACSKKNSTCCNVIILYSPT